MKGATNWAKDGADESAVALIKVQKILREEMNK